MNIISRRQAFLGLSMIAAPFVIRTPGLLMPVKYRPPRLDETSSNGKRSSGPETGKLTRQASQRSENEREGLNRMHDQGMFVSWSAEGMGEIIIMGDAEDRFKRWGCCEG